MNEEEGVTSFVFGLDSYTVRFFDGVVRTVKPTKVKPFQRVRNTAFAFAPASPSDVLLILSDV